MKTERTTIESPAGGRCLTLIIRWSNLMIGLGWVTRYKGVPKMFHYDKEPIIYEDLSVQLTAYQIHIWRLRLGIAF